MAAALRFAARRLVLGGGGGLQRTPSEAAEMGQRRLSPRFTHSGRQFSSYERGEADRLRTFEERVALWKRAGHLLFRTANAASLYVASYYILKFSVELAVNEHREHGYMVRKAASLVKEAESKLRSFRDD